jgi:antitoxin component YwqK of YwqJK toxin-antitoxin module
MSPEYLDCDVDRILAKDDETDASLRANSANAISNVATRKETHTHGRVHITWSAGLGDDGRYPLHGLERWYYCDGQLQYEAIFEPGRKAGRETLYDARSEWTQFWPSEKVRAQSSWQDLHADGLARLWDNDGKLLSEVRFTRGKLFPLSETARSPK